MKIVILTQYFPPDQAGWIPKDIATELDSRGHEVKVLTTFPHYMTDKLAKDSKQKFPRVEKQGRIQIRRVPIFPFHSGNALGRAVNYLSFAFSARMAKNFVKDADVIFVHGTPATVAAPARSWAKAFDIPFVYHVQDIWPESVTESGFLPARVSKVTEKIINRWLKQVYSSATAVNAIAPTAQELLINRGVPRSKCHLVFNWSNDTSELDQIERTRSSQHTGLRLIYAGTLGFFQDLETVVRAAHSVRDLERFRLQIAGTGVAEEHLRKLVNTLGANAYVEFLGRLDREEVAELYASADFQIVSLKNLDIFAGTIPSKFQSGLAHGLPLITTVKGDVTRLVTEHGLGYSALPENVQSVAAAFRKAHATSAEERLALSRRARDFYDTNLSKTGAIDRIESILLGASEAVETAVKL